MMRAPTPRARSANTADILGILLISGAAIAAALSIGAAPSLARAGERVEPREVVAGDTAASNARRPPDERLEPGVPILGIVVADEPRAYALADLRNTGAIVHDVVGGTRIDLGYDAADEMMIEPSSRLAERRMTSWSQWIRRHPDTSLWRVPAVAEAAPERSTGDVRVTESHHYRTAFGCALTPSRITAAGVIEPPGLVVISGTITNVAREPVHHVVLRYELVDDKGTVVYRDEGFNRSAEALAAPRLADADAVVPVDAGATDTFRMIFLADELPRFERTRVTVVRVH